jgi:hypothetical protein
MELTTAHWVYAVFVGLVIVTMALRRDALIPCIAGTFTLGWIITGKPLGGVETVFKSLVVATKELLSIILVISAIVGLTTALEDMGAGRPMTAPARKLMKSPVVAYWVVGVVMLIASYFIWPSPAAALLGAILIPSVSAVGLPPISAAVSMSLCGYGIALSTDYVIQGAPAISAKAANLSVEAVMHSQIPLILVMSVVALGVAFWMARKDIARASDSNTSPPAGAKCGTALEEEPVPLGRFLTHGSRAASRDAVSSIEVLQDQRPTSAIARSAAIVVPASYLLVVVALVALHIRGSEATTVVGGVTLLLLATFALVGHGFDGFNVITRNLIAGFNFGMKVFTQVVVIASFFYLGSPELAPQVFGEGARGLLFDLAKALSNVLPLNRVTVGTIETATGCVVGLDGSAFAGLPLTGSLAGSLAAVAGLKVATVAALGQIASVWVGAGCIPWGVLAVGASMCGVSPIELARKNLIPVLCGLAATTLVSIFLM